MFETSVYSLVLFVHVVAAIALMGGSLFAPFARKLIVNASSLGELKTALDLGRQSARFNPPVAMVLLASGIYLGSLGWWGQPWFFVSAGAWIANSLLATLIVKRAAVAVAQAAFQQGEGLSEKVDKLRRSLAWTIGARMMLANDFAILYVMMNKPGLAESLVLLLAAHAVLVLPCFVRAEGRRPVQLASRTS